MEYVMDYAGEPAPLDEVVEDNGVTIVIDAKAVLFLLGSELDNFRNKVRHLFPSSLLRFDTD